MGGVNGVLYAAAQMNWPNIIRIVTLVILVGAGIADYGFGVIARQIPNEAYFGGIAIVLGVDIKVITNAIMRLLGGDKDA